MAHSIFSGIVINSTEKYESESEASIYNYSPKRSLRYTIFLISLACIFLAVSYMLFDKVSRGVYLNRTMNEHLGFAGFTLSLIGVSISILIFLAAFQLFP